jgi:hypothetical protein
MPNQENKKEVVIPPKHKCIGYPYYNYMKKKILIILIGIFLALSILSVNSVLASFTIPHEYWTIYDCENSNSAIAKQCCGSRLQILVDGNAGADKYVIHYIDATKVGSYIATHTRGNYLNCLQWAGTDPDLQCKCYGMGEHQTQDILFHTDFNGTKGLVPTYLQSTFSSNLGGHMTIENDYDKKFQIKYANDPIFSTGKLATIDKNLLISTDLQGIDCNKLTGDNKYLDLDVKVTGLTLEQVRKDACTFTIGYHGVGFKDTAYGNGNLTLPLFFWLIAIVIIIVGIVGVLGTFFIPRLLNIKPNAWIFLSYLIFIVILLIGLILLISLIFNFTWALTRIFVSFLPISVSKNDVIKFNTLEKSYSLSFLNTANLVNDQNSGLQYYDRNGQLIAGALANAEKPFLYIALPIYSFILIYLLSWIFFKSFRKKKIDDKLLKIYNISGYVLLGILTLLLIYLFFMFFTNALPQILNQKTI